MVTVSAEEVGHLLILITGSSLIGLGYCTIKALLWLDQALNLAINGLGPLSVKAKRVCLSRYGNRLVMTQGILISKGQPCPTSSAASVLVLLLLALILHAVILKYVHMYVSRKLVMKFSCFVIHTVKKEFFRRLKSLALSIDYFCMCLTGVLALLNTHINFMLQWRFFSESCKTKYWTSEQISEYSEHWLPIVLEPHIRLCWSNNGNLWSFFCWCYFIIPTTVLLCVQ